MVNSLREQDDRVRLAELIARLDEHEATCRQCGAFFMGDAAARCPRNAQLRDLIARTEEDTRDNALKEELLYLTRLMRGS